MIEEPTAAGAVLFARYAYPPNELGYCGPTDSTLLEHDTEAELRRRARAFDGAWPYLRMLAAAGGIPDPLDPRVVAAYWVGNDLLDRVDPVRFADEVRSTFGTQTRGQWRTLDIHAPASPPIAHHSFHVLEVYPWVGLLGTGSAPALMVLDRCRIRSGQVVEVDGEQVVVRSRPLTWDGSALGVGAERSERARWSTDGRSWLPGLQPGDLVSLHWDWVCDRLDEASVAVLEQRTASQLDATNRWLAAAPTPPA